MKDNCINILNFIVVNREGTQLIENQQSSQIMDHKFSLIPKCFGLSGHQQGDYIRYYSEELNT